MVNGSPRLEKSTSLVFLKDLEAGLGTEDFRTVFISLNIKKGGAVPQESLLVLAEADVIIFSFPLYAYSLPAPLIKLLEAYYHWSIEQKDNSAVKRVYAVVNSGFPESSINKEALRVIKLFCRRTGFTWRFGAAIGGGMVVAMMKHIPLVNRRLKKVYKKIIDDIFQGSESPAEDIAIKPVIPKPVMLYMKDSKFSKRMMAKKI